MTVHEDGVWRFAEALWRRLGPGRTFTLQPSYRGVCDADPLLREIDNALESKVRGDGGSIAILISLGFVKEHLSADERTVTYQLVEVAPKRDERSLVEIEQQVIDRAVAAERERLRHEQEIAAQHARFFAGPSQAQQIREVVLQTVGEALTEVTARMAELEATLARLEANLENTRVAEVVS